MFLEKQMLNFSNLGLKTENEIIFVPNKHNKPTEKILIFTIFENSEGQTALVMIRSERVKREWVFELELKLGIFREIQV